MGRRLAAVTGATGFLGRHIVRALADQGWSVRVLVRRDPVHPLWRGVEPEAVIGDLGDELSLARLCDGAEALVHAAGLIKARTRAGFAQVNEEGARRVAAASARAGVEHVVLVSSLAAREPQLSHYAATKRAGETAALGLLGQRLTIVRPPAVYGPGDTETLPLFQVAQSGPLLPAFDRDSRIALIHVEDAARQIAAALQARPVKRLIALSDTRPDGYTWREIMQTAAEALGSRTPVVDLPSWAVTAAGWAGALAQLAGANPMLSPGKARELRHRDWSVRPDEQWLEAPPARHSLRSGFAQTVAWCQTIGWLRK